MARILLVEADTIVAATLRDALTNHDVRLATAVEVPDVLEEFPADLLFLDFSYGDDSEVAFLEVLDPFPGNGFPEVRLVATTSRGACFDDLARLSRREGWSLLIKPFGKKELLTTVTNCLNFRGLS